MKLIYTIITVLSIFTSSSLLQAQALNGTYTIGGTNADYATFQLAINDLQANGVASGGVTFNVAAGEYNERITLENITGLSETSRLTFFGTPNTVTIQASGTTANSDALIRVNALSFITFDGINVVDGSSAGSEIEFGYYFVGSATAGCSNNIIRNSSVFLGASGARPIIATRGIFFSSVGVSLASSNSNNIIDNVNIDNSSWGVYFRCAADFFGRIIQADFNNQVINSTFGAIQSLGHDFSSGALAINALGGRNMIIKNNVIASIENLNSNPTGVVLTTGISLDSCSGEVTGNQINSIVYDGLRGSLFGIRSSTFLGDTTLITNNKVSGLTRNNIVASTTDAGFTTTGIWIFNQGGNNGLARVLHNTVFLDAEEPVTYNSAGVHLSGGTTGKFPGEFFNNIIINNISTSSDQYRSIAMADGNTQRGFLIADNNNLFASGTNGYLGAIGRELNGTEQFSNDLQSFINFSETNDNSVNFLPLFTDAAAGDLSFPDNLVSSASYFGPNLPEVSRDILGFTRGTPDTFLGAYEGPIVLSTDDVFSSSVLIYPNPAKEFLKVQLPNNSLADFQATIYNQLGQQVYQTKNTMELGAADEIVIPIQNLQRGLYFLQIKSGNLETTKKFLAQ